MTKAANGELKGILGINKQPLVSKDFNHDAHSSIFDVTKLRLSKINLVEYYLGMIMNGVFQIGCVIHQYKYQNLFNKWK